LNDFNIKTIGEFHDNSNLIYLILKITNLFFAIIDVNSNIYFFAGGTPGLVSLACKLTQHKLIFHISSDAIIDNNIIKNDIKEFKRHPLSIDRIGNWLDIKISDVLIVQNNFQKRALKNNFNKNSTLIKMPSQLVDPRKIVKAKPPIVLWVGSMAEVKQPEIFLRLAEAIPEAKFQIIGGYSGCQMLYDSIKNKSKDLSNLEFCGVIPLDKINTYFGNASILVNTSLFEGFPNSFIQAWMNYTPVISLNADPDEIICDYALGFHSKTFDQMVRDIKTLLNDEQLRLKIAP
jgi:glycosyltransferase involved in cell wall biosynthesis